MKYAYKYLQHSPSPNARYLDILQRSEEEYVALKDQIKAAKAATKKVPASKLSPRSRTDLHFQSKEPFRIGLGVCLAVYGNGQGASFL